MVDSTLTFFVLFSFSFSFCCSSSFYTSVLSRDRGPIHRASSFIPGRRSYHNLRAAAATHCRRIAHFSSCESVFAVTKVHFRYSYLFLLQLQERGAKCTLAARNMFAVFRVLLLLCLYLFLFLPQMIVSTKEHSYGFDATNHCCNRTFSNVLQLRKKKTKKTCGSFLAAQSIFSLQNYLPFWRRQK